MSPIGTFVDPELEKAFEKDELHRLRRIIAVGLVAVGVLNTLFLIPEYFTGGLQGVLLPAAAARLVMLLLFAALAVIAGCTRSGRLYRRSATAVMLLYPVFYLYILYTTQQLDYLLKCLDIIVIITLMFCLPNRWYNDFIAAVFACVSFFVFARLVIPGLSGSDYAAGIVYVSIMLTVECAARLIFDRYKRCQYRDASIAKELIDTDYLTGIFSRVRFDEESRLAVGTAEANAAPLCLAVFDIDDFKKVNDSYGHLAGDRVLTGVTSMVSETLRPGEIFARWGGEEFVLLMPGVPLTQALVRICALRARIDSRTFAEGIPVTCSFGVACYRSGETLDCFFDRADKLMYAAKRSGKNLVLPDRQP